jgi:hypothetical protein
VNLEEEAPTSEKCSPPGRIGKRAVTWDGFSTLERSMQSCERFLLECVRQSATSSETA